MIERLKISSPKRKRTRTEWEGFYPYYAGFPEHFAEQILSSAGLTSDCLVIDPWNGSGTTTFAAASLGLHSCGYDLNPVMVLVSRARLLPPTEADSLEPLAREIVASLPAHDLVKDDPLLGWFDPATSAHTRALERAISRHLLGELSQTPNGTKFDRVSGVAATFFIAAFSICRDMVRNFGTSNPTWIKQAKVGQRVSAERESIHGSFVEKIRDLSRALSLSNGLHLRDVVQPQLKVVDTSLEPIGRDTADFVLTSPPYCTRIDYTCATRVELAILAPLMEIPVLDLSRQMLGSIRVPSKSKEPIPEWGPSCNRFLEQVREHPSKASSTYYYKTHIDYFAKMFASLSNIGGGLKRGGTAVIVVQDSNYKDVHNDLPRHIEEMAAANGMSLQRRENFYLNATLAGINPHTKGRSGRGTAVESVLCFTKL